MSERDFQIGEKKFKLSKLDAFKQFHIVRRLGPILGEIIPAAQKLKIKAVGDGEKSQAQVMREIGIIVQPIMKGLALLSDEDSEFVLKGLCSAVEIQQEHGNWARLSDGKVMSIQTLDLAEMLQAAGQAFAYNLAGFFPSAHQNSPGKMKR